MPQDLNPAQREAVHTLSGPLLVLAGAGTGKTRVVTYRIAELIRQGTPPERILAVTFTNKAAVEMHQRAAGLLGKRRKAKPEISTFHSLCVRLLRRHIRRLGYPEKFAIYDRGDQESVARTALREISAPGDSLRPAELIDFIGRWKTVSAAPEQAEALAATDQEHLAAVAYRRYQNALKAAGAVDFDDLLMLTERLLTQFSDVSAEESGRFDHLLIDEYQDTNGPQYRITKALALPHRNLCVVGDDDQSIYGWRGADVSHILGFRRDWPDAKVVKLEANYRSTEAILAMANRLIAFNRRRHDKILRAARASGEQPRVLQFESEAAEAEQIVEQIRRQVVERQAQPRDFAILFRTNTQPRAFEMELRRVKLPYVLIGGMSFYDRKEVRDAMAYLKLLVHPHDEVSLLRVINVPARGIGRGVVEALMAAAVAARRPLPEILPDAAGIVGISAHAAEAVTRFTRMIDRHRARLGRDLPVDVAADLFYEVGYEDELRRIYRDPNDAAARWNSVEEVVNALAQHGERAAQPSLAKFLDDVALGERDDDDEKQSQLGRNAVVLMTLHSAKGLEFSQVFMVGMEEGLLPHHRSVAIDLELPGSAAIDEERRLCYVGVTRARDRLTLSRAMSRRKWGKPLPTLPSRFLFELTGKADNPKYLEVQKPPPPSFRPYRTASSGQRSARSQKPQKRSPSTNTRRNSR